MKHRNILKPFFKKFCNSGKKLLKTNEIQKSMSNLNSCNLLNV